MDHHKTKQTIPLVPSLTHSLTQKAVSRQFCHITTTTTATALLHSGSHSATISSSSIRADGVIGVIGVTGVGRRHAGYYGRLAPPSGLIGYVQRRRVPTATAIPIAVNVDVDVD